MNQINQMNSKNLFMAGAFIVLVINAIVLSGVAYNRSGEPESVITLSGREMEVSRSYTSDFKNSGISLRINWRALGKEKTLDEISDYFDWRSLHWLDEKKLEELGFDIKRYAKRNTNHYQDLPEKEVCLVLENNGEAYREAVKRAEKALASAEAKLKENPDSKDLIDRRKSAEEELKNEIKSRSRLFVIDAGLEASALRSKYPDKNRYMITKGIVRPGYDYSDEKATKRLTGWISRLGVVSLHLPLEYEKKLESFKNSKMNEDCGKYSEYQCYEIELFYGKRLEPWINQIKESEQPL